MLAFISAHLKQIITAAFIIGLANLLIRFLDGSLSDATKAKIGDWIEDKTLRVDAVNLESLYQVARRFKWLFAATFVALGVIYLAVTFNAGHFDTSQLVELSALRIVTIFLLGGLILKILGNLSFKQALTHTWGDTWPMVAVMVLSSIGAWIVLAIVERIPITDLYELNPVWVYMVKQVLVPIFGLVPLILLILLWSPILALSKSLWWIATYPKGPWAGLVAVFTFGLGVLRLFL